MATALQSSWNHTRCDGCGHTFRRGDRVRIGADGAGRRTVRHVDPTLRCPPADDAPPSTSPQEEAREPEPDAAAASGQAVDAFVDGLLAAWPPPEGRTVVRLQAGDPPTVWAAPNVERPRCLYCAHSFRIGELVVRCPCGARPEVCWAAVHRDPARGLTCWETWRADGMVDHCPITFRRTGD